MKTAETTNKTRGDNIRLRKDGRWEGRYSRGIVNGKRCRVSVFGSTYEEAQEKLERSRAEYAAILAEEKARQKQLEADAASRLFRSVAEEWFDSIRPRLRPSTIVSYSTILQNHLIPAVGDRPISTITRGDVNDLISGLLYPAIGTDEAGCCIKPLSPKTVSCILSVLKLVFNYADEVKNYSVANLNSITIKQLKKPLRVLTHFEQEKIEKEIMGYDDNTGISLTYFGILLSLYTGLRVGELCALTWGDISKPEKTISVHKTLQRVQRFSDDHDRSGHITGRNNTDNRTEIIIGPPKSASSIRLIPIPGYILPLVEQLRRESECYVLTGQKGRFIEPRLIEHRFKRLMRKCQIEGATMHTCRHTFATRCIELGFDPKTLSEILGHSSVNMTLNRYVHPSMTQKAKSMDRLQPTWSGSSQKEVKAV